MAAESGATRRDRVLQRLLRALGIIDLFAVAVVFLPHETLNEFQRAFQLDAAADDRLVEYLIRSTSALYALHGALMLALSADIDRYRPVIRWLGWLAVAHGVIMLYVDLRLGMPAWWRWLEGPTFAACGIAVLLLSKPQTAETSHLSEDVLNEGGPSE